MLTRTPPAQRVPEGPRRCAVSVLCSVAAGLGRLGVAHGAKHQSRSLRVFVRLSSCVYACVYVYMYSVAISWLLSVGTRTSLVRSVRIRRRALHPTLPDGSPSPVKERSGALPAPSARRSKGFRRQHAVFFFPVTPTQAIPVGHCVFDFRTLQNYISRNTWGRCMASWVQVGSVPETSLPDHFPPQPFGHHVQNVARTAPAAKCSSNNYRGSFLGFVHAPTGGIRPVWADMFQIRPARVRPSRADFDQQLTILSPEMALTLADIGRGRSKLSSNRPRLSDFLDGKSCARRCWVSRAVHRPVQCRGV